MSWGALTAGKRGSVRDAQHEFAANVAFTNPFEGVAEFDQRVDTSDDRLDDALRHDVRHLRKIRHACRAARRHATHAASRLLDEECRFR